MAGSDKHKILFIGVIIAALILLGKIFYIQIINSRYKTDAANNSMVYDVIYPPRGLIYDRNGEILVGNKVCYDIMVTPRDVESFDTLKLASVLGIEPEYIREKMAYYRKYRTRIGFQKVTFLKQVDAPTFMRFSELQYMFHGFSSMPRSIRNYPFNAGGNLLGYISEVNEDDIRNNAEYRAGDFIGKTGIEAAMEDVLKGEKGYHIMLRDSRNKVQTRYNDGKFDKDAQMGKNIVTTIDAHLQQYGQELMKGKMGSIVALEPSTGEILSMVSSPGIDVDILANVGKYYGALVKDPHKPMFNRTVQASYPPGSVFKLVNGLIGLQEEVIDTDIAFPCNNGYYYTATRKLGCHSHQSPLRLEQAVMMSCNSYFCYVLKRILQNKKYDSTEEAFDAWREYVCSFGFGEKLGSDFPSELGGNIPTSKFYNKRYGKGLWRFETVISLSIGQGEIGATPLQIANLSAIVANRGYYITPHIIKDSEEHKIEAEYHEKKYTKIDSEQFEKVIGGMWLAVNAGYGSGGTASIAAVPGLDICGKTGTAQNPHGKDHSVFICFAPRENPKIAVAAYVENAGFGATWACPIASLMIEKYLNGEISEERKALEERIINTVTMQ